MGRKSKLTEKQWEEVGRRHLEGESLRSLAREFGVGESTVREKISAQSAQIKKVANQIVEVEIAKKNLPVSAQISALNLAQRLLMISESLSDAAVAGANTAKLISERTHEKLSKLQTLTDEDVKGAIAASMAVNQSGKMGMDILTLTTKPNGAGALNNPGNSDPRHIQDLTDDELLEIARG